MGIRTCGLSRTSTAHPRPSRNRSSAARPRWSATRPAATSSRSRTGLAWNGFLILGTEGGTYYTDARTLTLDNAAVVRRCLAADGPRTVRTIAEVSIRGRAPSNDPALFALAMAASFGDPEVRRAAGEVLPRVARIGTHLLHFVSFVNDMRGWGRSIKRAVGCWYTEQELDRLTRQVLKYRQRDGWSHRDVLRLTHPKSAPRGASERSDEVDNASGHGPDRSGSVADGGSRSVGCSTPGRQRRPRVC